MGHFCVNSIILLPISQNTRFHFKVTKQEKKILLVFFPDALTDLVGDEYLVTGENATAGIWATYPTQGISTVNCKVFIFNFTNFACTYKIFL